MNMNRMRQLAGLGHRYLFSLKEGVEPETPDSEFDPYADPEDPEDDGLEGEEPEKPLEDDDDDPEEEPEVPPDQWEHYRSTQERALKLAQENSKMLKSLSGLQEDGMPTVQRKAFRAAKRAVSEALKAQRAAYRCVSTYGSTLLGR